MLRLAYQLARLYGAQTVYYDVFRRRCQASAEAVLGVLRSLGAPVTTLEDVPSAWRQAQLERWIRPLEPVTVAWEGRPAPIRLRLPAAIAESKLVINLGLEDGGSERWEQRVGELPTLESARVEGTDYVVKGFRLPRRLPWGYHRLAVELAGRQGEALIVAAPLKSYAPPRNRRWGAFIPLYALYSERSLGSGDFSDLGQFMSWVARLGGGVVATLPLLPVSVDKTAEASPYLPISRLMWNEAYLDISRVPELQGCPSAQATLASPAFSEEIDRLRRLSLVDYRRLMTLRRQVIKELCRCLFSEASARLDALHRFVSDHPQTEEYARFRATGEKRGLPWRSWPQRPRDGFLSEGDYDEEVRRYYLYGQWLAHEQFEELMKETNQKGLQLYLDLPLGVHADGYDVWREQKIFALDASTGAPPDAVFTRGQDWHFPPPHPERVREQGYRYVIAYLRHHLRPGGWLRIDHIMGLHRLFWIPRGLDSGQGVYVRYHADELYAILALESHRRQAVLVGEDLGTVPPEVRPAMRRHGLQRMYVAQYEVVTNPQRALRPVPANAVASLNTHDMPPFASFWAGRDITERAQMGLLDSDGASKMRGERQAIRQALVTFLRAHGWINQPDPDASAVLKALLSSLAAGRAGLLLVNLEDLWLEARPQNIPSTLREYPNWRRKARYSLEAFCQMPGVTGTLHLIDRLRRGIKQ